MDDQEELARLNMVNMKIEGTNYYQNQEDSQKNSKFKGK